MRPGVTAGALGPFIVSLNTIFIIEYYFYKYDGSTRSFFFIRIEYSLFFRNLSGGGGVYTFARGAGQEH